MDTTIRDLERAATAGDERAAAKLVRELARCPVAFVPPTIFVHDDGGRAAAGFKGHTGDCVARAVSIASGRPYAEIYDRINALAANERRVHRLLKGDPLVKKLRRPSSARLGVYKPTTRKLLESLGAVWTPTMRIGSGCKVHLRADELPRGRLVVSVSRHVVAVIDGVIHDTYDPSRGGTRCVYGYWTFPARAKMPAKRRARVVSRRFTFPGSRRFTFPGDRP